jgi:hypothetical protein
MDEGRGQLKNTPGLKFEGSEISIDPQKSYSGIYSDCGQYPPARADTLPQLDLDRFFTLPSQFIIQ